MRLRIGISLVMTLMVAQGCAPEAEGDDDPQAETLEEGDAFERLALEQPAVKLTQAEAEKRSDYVQTPAGLVHESCIHEVREGEEFDETARALRSTTGATRAIAKCAYPVFARGAFDRAVVGDDAQPEISKEDVQRAASNGWHVAAWWNSPTWLRRMWVNMYVPQAPTLRNNQLLYYFPSFQNAAGDTIVQPVLQYGNNGRFGGYVWQIASWYVWPGGALHSAPVNVQPGSRIWGGLEANSCNSAGANCRWTITARDANRNIRTVLNIWSAVPFRNAQGGVFEAYRLAGCGAMPSDRHIEFSGHQVFDGALRRVGPSWSTVWWHRPCSMSVAYRSNNFVEIRWR